MFSIAKGVTIATSFRQSQYILVDLLRRQCTYESEEPFREGPYGRADVPNVKWRDFGCVEPRNGIPGHTEDKLEQEQESESELAGRRGVDSNASGK